MEDSALALYRQHRRQCLFPSSRRKTTSTSESSHNLKRVTFEESHWEDCHRVQGSDNIKIDTVFRERRQTESITSWWQPVLTQCMTWTQSWKSSQRRLLNLDGSPHQVPYHLHCGKIAGFLLRELFQMSGSVCPLHTLKVNLANFPRSK